LFEQKAGPFIKAQQRAKGIIGLFILMKYILQMPQIGTGDDADTPLLGEPGL
jgi:hypothetical protein